MLHHARIGWGTSAAVHAGLAVAGLLIAAPDVAPHFHFQRGAIELTGSLAPSVAQAAQSSLDAGENPAETSFEAAPSEADPRDPATSVTKSPSATLAWAKTATLEPAQCDCPAHDATLQTPKRAKQEPAEDVRSPEAPPTLERARTVAQLSTSGAAAAASVPASSEPAGADYDQPPTAAPTNRPPPYPAEAYQARLQGRILLEVHINTAGAVESLRILESSGVDALDRSALDTVRQWRFAPARRAGQSVAATVNIPVRFAIRAS